MKIILTISVCVFLAVASLGSVKLVKANWMIPVCNVPPAQPWIMMLYPEPDTACGRTVQVEFLLIGPGWAYNNLLKVSQISYSLDSVPTARLDATNYTVSDNVNLIVHFLGNISGLSHGNHRLKISAQYKGYYSTKPYEAEPFEASTSSNIAFTVDTSLIASPRDVIAPELSIQNPKPQDYSVKSIPITIMSERLSIVTYSLDRASPVTITSNTTLNDLSKIRGDLAVFPDYAPVSNGSHTLVVNARDISGNIKSAEVNFTVNTPQKPRTTPPLPKGANETAIISELDVTAIAPSLYVFVMPLVVVAVGAIIVYVNKHIKHMNR